MANEFDKYPINNPKLDRRVKLSNEDRENIRAEYATGLVSQRQLAAKYKVSRRLIQFTLNPEKHEIAKQQHKERQRDGRYYDKDKHREYMRKHRQHKRELWEQGLIKTDNKLEESK